MGPTPHRPMLSTVSLQGLRHGLPRTPKSPFYLSVSATFFSLFSFFPCTEVLEALMGPSKGIPRLGLEPLGPLLSNLGTLGQEVAVVISH